MLKIRLQRVGRKNDPSFRVVVIESHRAPKSGAAIEILGNYDARQKRVVLKRERIDYWVSKGAQTSQTVQDLLRKNTAK
jgi:small subunit ribosomal protein S16